MSPLSLRETPCIPVVTCSFEPCWTKKEPKDLRWALIHQGAQQRDVSSLWIRGSDQHSGGKCFCCVSLFSWAWNSIEFLGVECQVWVLDQSFFGWLEEHVVNCLFFGVSIFLAFHFGKRFQDFSPDWQKVVWWGICFRKCTYFKIGETVQWDSGFGGNGKGWSW